MKILYVQDSLGTGGAERSNAELWYYLRKRNIDFKIIVLEKRKQGIQKEILKENFPVIFLKKRNFVAQTLEISQIIKNYKPDIVHSVLFKATFRVRAAKLFTRFFNVESLVNCSYDEVRYKDPRVNSFSLKLYEYIDRLTSSIFTDHFIAITNEVKKHHIQHLKIKNSKKISVIPRGRKENEFLKSRDKIKSEVKEEFGLKTADLIFVNVGRQEFQKGHLTLLNAIKSCDKELHKLNVNFIICGREGNATPEINLFMKNNSLHTQIEFIGNRNDIYKILAASDAFVFPSLYEGLGGSLLEAQAAGLPIICSNIPVFHEIVSTKNALFFNRHDYNELGNKLLDLVNSGEKRNSMGKESYDNYLTNYRLENINEKMLSFYKKITLSL